VAEAFDLTGRTAVIAGAGSDIGTATALRLARAGADVVLGDLDAERLARAADALAADGHVPLSLPTDVASRPEVDALVRAAVERFGRIDVMANLAGVIQDALVEETLEADLDRILAVNLKGVFFGCQAAAAAMRPQGSGSIVNMASSAAFAPFPKLASYSISKAGVVALTRVLAAEVGPAGIRVNAIAPGFIEGGMSARRSRRADGSFDAERLEAERERARRRTPLRSTGRPDDVAHAIWYLASDASRYVTGQVLHPNGGALMV